MNYRNKLVRRASVGVVMSAVALLASSAALACGIGCATPAASFVVALVSLAWIFFLPTLFRFGDRARAALGAWRSRRQGADRVG